MKDKEKDFLLTMISFVFILFTIIISFHTKEVYASGNNKSDLINKVSKSYTKKFCNAIGFGLSKESAMKFSLEENKQVFKKKKEINKIDKELLAGEIALSVVEKCGYPINLSGEKGILEFKNYYLIQDNISTS